MRIGQNGSCWELFLDYQFKVNGEKLIFFANRRDSNQFSSSKNLRQPSIMFYTLSSVRPKLSTMKKNVLHQNAGTRSIRSASSEYHFIHARTERHDHESRRSQTPRNNSNSFFTPNYFVMIHSAQFIFRFYLLAIRSSRFIPLTPYFHFTTF